MGTTILKRFRKIGFIEGLSYLTLLFIAMPLKYGFDMPLAVKFVGMAHGALFMGYIVLLAMAVDKYNWNIRYAVILFVASLIPFGTFYTDKKLKVLEEMLEAREAKEKVS
ncbi:MAG TPA: DUF3817 domain-containing protein [Campylobacterales bacterium]|nr:DUF3817 domain-containing protein [Campylobacterales bacterium]